MNYNDYGSEFVKNIIPGTMAGFSQTMVGFPFDSVKVRFVASGSKSIYSCIKTMWKENGIKTFYQGVRSPLYGGIFYNTSLFYSYNIFDKFLNLKKDTNTDIFNNAFIVGSLTGITTTVIESPVDLIKTQMQINNKLEFKDALKIPVRKMYRGVYPTLIRNIPSVGLYFGIFEYTQLYFKNNPLIGSFIAGSLAGAACWGVTYPLDNIKTRIQSDHLEERKRRYKNTIDCIRKTSFRSMWKGFIPCMIRAVPVNGALFLGYTYSRNMLNKD